MANDKVLPEGIRMFPKHQNAPEFVKGAMVITLNKLVEFCKSRPDLLTEYNGEKQLKLQLLESKDGKPYLSVDTFKPGETPRASAPASGSGKKPSLVDEINGPDDSGLPF